MPFDYNEFSQGVQKAREAKVNDNDILSHLASLDQGFKDAKENGYTLEEVDNFLKEKYKTQGGDKNAYQTSQSSDGSSQESNAQGGQAVPIQAGSSEGVQPNEQPSSKDQQVVQRGQQANLKIKTDLTGDSQFGIGGEPLEKQEQMSVGSGYTGPQAKIQQAIPSKGKAGEQAEVTPKAAPFPTVQSQGEVGAGEAFGRSLMEGVAKTNDLIVEGLGVFPYLEDKTMKMFGVDSDIYEQWKKAASDAGIASPEAYSIKQNEQLTTGGKITQQFGSFAADILPMIATGGIGAEVKGMQLASSETMGILDALKASLPKIRESVQAMAIPALKAGSEAAKQSAESGDSALKQTAKGIASAATTAITGAIPMSAESKVANRILRFMQQGALGFLTGMPIAEQQKVVDAWISGKPYVPSSFKDMALQAIPMALITGAFGVLHAPAKKITSDMYTDLEDLSLSETAKVLKEQEQNPLPQPKTFISKENLLAKGQKRYTELSAKRDSGEVLSPEEAKEFEVLQKVPTTEELADHYGHEIQEPKQKQATAKAEAQPEKTSEEQVQKTGGIPTEQGKPVVEAPAVKTEEGVAPREGEGKKEVTSFSEASTPEEVDAFLKKTLKEFEAVESIAAPGIKNKNALLNQVRKAAFSRKKEIKAEQKAAAKAEAAIPKPSEKPVMEAPAPEQEPAPEEGPKEQGEPKARKPRKEKPSEPMGTRVLSAAYRPNKGPNKGTVFYGSSHKQAMLKSGMSWMEIQKDYAHPEQREGIEFGYKTDTKPFVSRDKGEQVARLSEQVNTKKLDADKALGFKMHSNHLAMDDHPETAGNKTDLPIAAGAMNALEGEVPFDETKDHNSDIVKSAQIHKDLAQGEFEGGTNYSKWSKAFEKAFENAKDYSEDQRFNLFKQGEAAAAHSEFFEKPLDLTVRHPNLWEGKSVPEIKIESIERETKDIGGTNDDIDRARVARGLNPAMREAAITCGTHWEAAMQLINSRKGYAASFVEGLKNNPRGLSPVETALLRYSVIDAMHAMDAADVKVELATDPRLIARYNREFEDAARKYAELSQLNFRTNSEAGRSLQFLKLLVKSDYSLPRLLTRALSAKKTGGKLKGKVELSDKEVTDLTNLSRDVERAEKEYSDALEKTKLKENTQGLIEYLEFSSRMISTIEGERSTPKEELQKFTTMLKCNRQDPVTMGMAMRGMARNLSQLLKTKDSEKLSNEIHDRISKFMGDAWDKNQTLDALNGNGAFHQKSEQGLKSSISLSNDKTFAFDNQLRKALKMKNPKKKQFRLAKLVERFSVEVHNLDSQIRNHLDDAVIDADRIIGELENDLLSCE